MADKFEDECFFIAPIGPDGSDIRKRSDGVLNFVVRPAAAELGLTTVRADEIGSPGQITLQVLEHLLKVKAVIADLTGLNPNVFYELAVRHTARLPVVLIAEQGEDLPFDIAQMRTIFFDHRDLASASACKEEIIKHLQNALGGAVDSPIATALDIGSLEPGNPIERIVRDLVGRIEELAIRQQESIDLFRTLHLNDLRLTRGRHIPPLRRIMQSYPERIVKTRDRRFILVDIEGNGLYRSALFNSSGEISLMTEAEPVIISVDDDVFTEIQPGVYHRLDLQTLERHMSDEPTELPE